MADVIRVGLTTIAGTLTGPTGISATLELLIDSGAKYTLVPHDVWTRLGLKPKWRMRFQMADASTIERAISECHIAVAERDGHTTVILGEPGDVALLGVVTLEQFGLVFYPFDRSLRTSDFSMLAAVSAA
jgi:predicted aspartyl protease